MDGGEIELKCPQCGNETSDEGAFCSRCGTPLEKQANVPPDNPEKEVERAECKTCGAPNTKDAVFCSKCGPA